MISSLSGSASSIASTLFSRLDTENQGYIEKTDLQSAFSGISETGSGDTTDVDAVFKQLDTDGDEKVTKDEMTAAIERLSDQLNAQFDQSRVRGGGGHGGQMPPPPPSQAQGSDDTQYIAAADTNGDGTVSTEEAAAYEASTSSESASGTDASDTGLQAMLAAAGGMPPPPMRGAEDTGFSKDELATQLSEIGSGDSKRSALLSKLIENFDAADANGDGKIAHDEAHAFGKEQGPEGSDSTRQDNDAVQARIVQLLRAYGMGSESDTSTTAGSISLTA